MSRPNAWIGSPVPRVEDERLVTGRGRFVGDLVPERLLHAVMLRSPQAHGSLRSIDAGAARDLPGVVAVFTAADVGAAGAVPLIPQRQHALPEGEAYRQPVIAVDKVRYVGEPVAVVIAEDPAIAEDALELIEVDIDPLPPVADHVAADSDAALLFEAAGSNRIAVLRARAGDADAAFAAADYTRRAQFGIQRHTALPMEPRGLCATFDPASGRLVLYGATKVPYYNRRALAGMLGLDIAAVDLIEVDVGGGFGARGEIYPEDFLVPFAAMRLGAAVRWIEDRREHLSACNHAREFHADLEIACRRDGTVLALRGRVDADLGAYARTNGFTPPRNVVQFMPGPYRIDHVAIDGHLLVTNKTPAGTYRGPGRFETSFFCERLFDMAAHDLGIDPVAFRRRNLLRKDELPRPFPGIVGVDAATELDNGDYAFVFQRCLDDFGWTEKAALQGRLIDGRYHGIAVASFIEGGGGAPRENARITVEADGGVAVDVGSSAIGQGLATVLSQIAADALGLPMSAVTLRHGSTTLVTEGFGSNHSRSTVMGGSAILVAAEALLAELRTVAAAELGGAATDVRIADGVVHGAAGQRPLSAFAGLSVERTYHNTKYTYSYGTHAAHVAVDPRTGHVEVIDYVTVEDVGRVINPATLHGQVIGAVVQGLGSVFLEHLVYDETGQLLTGSLADYLVPTATDVPRIRGVSLGLERCPNNPLGAKGAGEGGLIATGGVIANAVAAALRSFGVEPNHLPLSPPRVWRLIQEARRRQATPHETGQGAA
ncbi:xanthine dehydrogenase family protein molybdopterin-binding subunit [Rhodoplanes sp. TEM]|uniref:Xanthine dehydrogenase family protein molybdopterin-binding subunit n=1 Tax=Rhodoplanes tepidamans TaxID=200616 RepID=A0ABT5JCC3_RHOTP|nr:MULTISPECIES: xanthine dehydrogenase family protein molybdopterin-binding subunit [Rhodoplanes]MDC7787147.1 xanthine dehydrogenase family protein molybdopterin-binding subunit [Rhodoplanes tepidamans]MDC7984289.1 xanthine dehydrogenase family protein molybdopterin-binding subunit [Rhodoplanes sp. TEM]MDQ0356086.1 carbon-monoxide dehydrogenase large subunit [Rhodoplanes tepidamans]